MAIRTSLYFLYDGKNSLTDFGIVNVNISSGLLDEPFLATSHINETKIRGRDKPYFTTTTHDPLSFTLTFAFQDAFDNDKLRAVARWLNTGFYKTLQFSDNLDRVYFAMLDSDSHLVHNGSQGYITLTMRTDSPFSFSPTFLSPTFDLSSNPASGTIIQLPNKGDVSYFPEVYIDKVNNGEVEIISLSNGGISFKYSYLIADPTVAPVLSTVTNGASTLPATTYYVRYSWAGISGETNVSTEASIVFTSGKNLVITIPTLPSYASQANIYVSTSAGVETLQGNTPTTTFTISSPLVVGAPAPTSNSTGLRNAENVYTDCSNQIIQTDLSGFYRVNNFNNSYLEVVYGMNQLLVKGTCLLRFRYSYAYLQG